MKQTKKPTNQRKRKENVFAVLTHADAFFFFCLAVYTRECLFVCLFVCCLTSQQQAGVSQGRICSDNLTCCHTEIEVADQTIYLTLSQYTDTGPTSPSTDPKTPGAWQDSHWSANFKSLVWLDPKKSRRKRDSNPGSSAPEVDALTTRPGRRSTKE